MTSSADLEEMPEVLCAVVEAAPRVDAMFYGVWLQAVAKAHVLWMTVRMDTEVIGLFGGLIPDLGIAAIRIVCGSQNCHLITIDDQDDQYTTTTMTELALMIELGFFTLTGSRYQMTLPSREVDVEAVWAAVLKIVETEDEECLVHPEHFISAMRRADAEEWVRRLSDMSEWHRCADQEMLLGVLNRSSQILDEISGLDRPPIWDHTKKKTPPWSRPSGF